MSDIRAKIYLFLIESEIQKTPTEIAEAIGENRTTIYSAAEKLEKLGLVSKKNRGKVTAYIPNHPSALESLAEKRLRLATRQVKNLETNLPSLINYYNAHQFTPGVSTFYGQEGIDFIYNKILTTGKTEYFIRSRYDESADIKKFEDFKRKRVEAGIEAKSISPSEFSRYSDEQAKKFMLERTWLPADNYDSPVEIDIFGDNVAFINYAKNDMSTVIKSPEIADAMRQFFNFSAKYIKKATDEKSLPEKHK